MATTKTAPGAGETVSGGAGVRPGLALGASKLAPPFLLPGVHFAVGLAFLVLGAVGLVWVSSDLSAGRYLTPRVVGVTHLFTLGWITLSIFGSLYQFLPVALGQPIRSIGTAYVTLGLFAPGLAAFVYGLWAGVSLALVGGAVLFGVAIVVFCANLVGTLRRAERRDLTWWCLAGAVTCLFLTAAVGLALAVNLRWSFMGASRWPALGVHIHLALAGWVGLVVIGVGHRLLPMFLLSHGSREVWGQAAAWLVATGVGVLFFFHHGPPLLSQWVPAALIGLGLASFLAQAASFFRHSVKPRLDPGLRLVAGALVVLGSGLALGAWSMATGWTSATVTAAYGLALILGLSLFVAAHYYKIVPFLVWYHRYGPLVGQRPVPTVAGLYSERGAAVAALLMALGFSALVGAVLAGSSAVAAAAALVGAVGVGIEAAQMTLLARRRP